MANGSKGLKIVVGVVVLALIAGIVFPVLYVGTQNPQTESYGQEEAERLEIKTPLEANVTDVDAPNNTISVTLYNTNNGETREVNNIPENGNKTVSLSGYNITVKNNQITNVDMASVTYEFPVSIGWPDEAKMLFENSIILLLISFVIALLFLVVVVSEVIE